MKIRVDGDTCRGLNRCRATLPEMFETTADGKSQALNDGVVPEGLEQEAQDAIDGCPYRAIVVVAD
jgi:ferredoxin